MNEKKTIFIVAMSLVLILIGIVIGALLFGNSEKENTNNISEDKIIKVPMAKTFIGGGSKITEDLIDYVSIIEKFAQENNIVTSFEELKNMYIRNDFSVPQGGIFYKDQVIQEKELPNESYASLEEGHTIFALELGEYV